MLEKTCTKCGKTKTVDNFYKVTRKEGKYESRCKECTIKRQRDALMKKKKIVVSEKVCVFKECVHGGVPQDIDNFHKNILSVDSHNIYCKDCQKIVAERYLSKNVDEIRRKERERYWAGRKKPLNRIRKRNEEPALMLHPEKGAARLAVLNAKRRGEIPFASSLICADCGKPAKHYHHESYLPEHWLDVVPLCTLCHGKRHRKY